MWVLGKTLCPYKGWGSILKVLVRHLRLIWSQNVHHMGRIACHFKTLKKKDKTKELIVNYRKLRGEHAPIHINGVVVEGVESFKFLSVHITKEWYWSTHTTTVVKKARQRRFLLRRLKRFDMRPQILKKVQLHH